MTARRNFHCIWNASKPSLVEWAPDSTPTQLHTSGWHQKCKQYGSASFSLKFENIHCSFVFVFCSLSISTKHWFISYVLERVQTTWPMPKKIGHHECSWWNHAHDQPWLSCDPSVIIVLVMTELWLFSFWAVINSVALSSWLLFFPWGYFW